MASTWRSSLTNIRAFLDQAELNLADVQLQHQEAEARRQSGAKRLSGIPRLSLPDDQTSPALGSSRLRRTPPRGGSPLPGPQAPLSPKSPCTHPNISGGVFQDASLVRAGRPHGTPPVSPLTQSSPGVRRAPPLMSPRQRDPGTPPPSLKQLTADLESMAEAWRQRGTPGSNPAPSSARYVVSPRLVRQLAQERGGELEGVFGSAKGASSCSESEAAPLTLRRSDVEAEEGLGEESKSKNGTSGLEVLDADSGAEFSFRLGSGGGDAGERERGLENEVAAEAQGGGVEAGEQQTAAPLPEEAAECAASPSFDEVPSRRRSGSRRAPSANLEADLPASSATASFVGAAEGSALSVSSPIPGDCLGSAERSADAVLQAEKEPSVVEDGESESEVPQPPRRPGTPEKGEPEVAAAEEEAESWEEAGAAADVWVAPLVPGQALLEACTLSAPLSKACTLSAPLSEACTLSAPLSEACTLSAHVSETCTLSAPLSEACTLSAHLSEACTLSAHLSEACTLSAPISEACALSAPPSEPPPSPSASPSATSFASAASAAEGAPSPVLSPEALERRERALERLKGHRRASLGALTELRARAGELGLAEALQSLRRGAGGIPGAVSPEASEEIGGGPRYRRGEGGGLLRSPREEGEARDASGVASTGRPLRPLQVPDPDEASSGGGSEPPSVLMSGSDPGSAPASDPASASARPFLRRKSERVRSQALDWSSVRARTSSTRRGEGEASASPSPTARQFAEFAEVGRGGGRRASAPSGNGTPLGRDGSGNGTPLGRDGSGNGTPLGRDSSKAGTPFGLDSSNAGASFGRDSSKTSTPFGRDSSKAGTPMTSGAGTPLATPSGTQGQARGEGPAWRRPRTPGKAGPLDGLLGQVDALLFDVQRALR